jgi:hypothetical protein
MSNLLEKISLVHLGGEIVVIGVVFYYLYSRTSQLQMRVSTLEAKLVKFEEQLKLQNNTLYQLFNQQTINEPIKKMAQVIEKPVINETKISEELEELK